jgi:hypothetical protein
MIATGIIQLHSIVTRGHEEVQKYIADRADAREHREFAELPAVPGNFAGASMNA